MPNIRRMLALQGVSFNYGALRVTDDVSLGLAESEAVGIIGPNGAGKSTLFDLISGTRRPSSGRILIGNVEVSKLSPHVRCTQGLARTFQIPRPFDGMTVFENVLVGAMQGARLHGKEADRHCATVLDQTGLLHRANERAGTLRLLDRKRLELARAMSVRPKLLLLDEIAGGLSDAECVQLIDLIRLLRSEGVAILWIEHVVHALLAVVDRLIVLIDGRVLLDGPPREVINAPQVRQAYLGEQP